MPNYEEMYYTLFRKVTSVIDELQEVQKLTEEMFLDSENEQSFQVLEGGKNTPPEKRDVQ